MLLPLLRVAETDQRSKCLFVLILRNNRRNFSRAKHKALALGGSQGIHFDIPISNHAAVFHRQSKSKQRLGAAKQGDERQWEVTRAWGAAGQGYEIRDYWNFRSEPTSHDLPKSEASPSRDFAASKQHGPARRAGTAKVPRRIPTQNNVLITLEDRRCRYDIVGDNKLDPLSGVDHYWWLFWATDSRRVTLVSLSARHVATRLTLKNQRRDWPKIKGFLYYELHVVQKHKPKKRLTSPKFGL